MEGAILDRRLGKWHVRRALQTALGSTHPHVTNDAHNVNPLMVQQRAATDNFCRLDPKLPGKSFADDGHQGSTGTIGVRESPAGEEVDTESCKVSWGDDEPVPDIVGTGGRRRSVHEELGRETSVGLAGDATRGGDFRHGRLLPQIRRELLVEVPRSAGRVSGGTLQDEVK